MEKLDTRTRQRGAKLRYRRRGGSGRTNLVPHAYLNKVPRCEKATCLPRPTIVNPEQNSLPSGASQAQCLKQRKIEHNVTWTGATLRVVRVNAESFQLWGRRREPYVFTDSKQTNSTLNGLLFHPPTAPHLPPHLLSWPCPKNGRVGPPLSVVVLHGRVHQSLA